MPVLDEMSGRYRLREQPTVETKDPILLFLMTEVIQTEQRPLLIMWMRSPVVQLNNYHRMHR